MKLKSIIFIFMCLLASFLLSSCAERYDKDEVIDIAKSERFSELLQLLRKHDIQHFSVFRKKDLVVINNLAVNVEHKTYGIAPEAGLFQSYYDAAAATRYAKIEEVLLQASSNPQLSEAEFNTIFAFMAKVNMADIIFVSEHNIWMFEWGGSAIYGGVGVLIGQNEDIEQYNNSRHKAFSSLEPVENGLYYFIRI